MSTNIDRQIDAPITSNTTNPKAYKELVIFVPGMGSKEQEVYLDKLIAGIQENCSNTLVECNVIRPEKENGVWQRRVIIGQKDSPSKVMDVKEVFWKDLIPSLSSQSNTRKVINGLFLAVFWAASPKTWRQIWHNKYMMLSSTYILVVFMFWYYGALATTFTAIGSSPEFLKTQLPAPLAESITEFFKSAGSHMGGWAVWGLASLLISPLPVNEMLDVSYTTQCYLTNQNRLLNKLSGRVSKALMLAEKSKVDYDRITILSHSFGTVLALESVATFDSQTNPGFRFMTLGSPLLMIASRSEEINLALQKIIGILNEQSKNQIITSWIDFYSNDDWFCTFMPIPKGTKNFESEKIKVNVPIYDKIKGVSHDLYFDDPHVIKKLLAN